MEMTRNLTDKEYAELVAAKDARKAAIARTMTKVRKALTRAKRTTGAEIHAGWKDVNCFFPYGVEPGNRILHVEVSPVPGDDSQLRITMRELDQAVMLEERQRVSIGAEHQAEVRIIRKPTLIPNAPGSIARLLRRELPLPQKTA